MANTTQNIITQISRKNTTGFDTPFPIGSNARYITGIRGTSVNNIEENFLLGTDIISTEENPSEGVTHIIEEYRTEEVENNYYFMDIYIFDNYSAYKRWFYGDTLYLPSDINDNTYDSVEEMLVGVDTSAYSIVGERFTIVNNETPIEDIVIRKDTLKYVNNSEVTISVAEKTTFAKVEKNGKKIQKVVIRNLL